MIELTDMLRVERRAPNLLKHRPELFVLYRWEPSDWRRSGVYKPLTRPLTAEQMREYLDDMDLGSKALQRFNDSVRVLSSV